MHPDVNLLRKSLEVINEPLFIVFKDWRCVFVNQAFRDLLSLDLVGDQECDVRDFWPSICSVDLSRKEFYTRFVFPGSLQAPVKLEVHQLENNCHLVRVLGSAFKEPTSADYFHSQRLQTLGMLAGGVAHDFNNVLAGILGHVTYLKTILPNTGPHVESLCALEEGGGKASLLTREILNFSRMETDAEPEPTNLCLLVEKTCRLLRGGLSPLYSLNYCLPEAAVSVLGVEARLAQIVANLVVNSRDAIDGEGEIIVRVRGDIHGSELGEAAVHTNGDHTFALLQVEDNGAGIPEDILDRVLEPYFSTKPEIGTGLGLATVSNIVKAMGGVLNINSAVGKGTAVSVYLPMPSGGIAAKSVVQDQQEELLTGIERILVVDDEDPVRNVLCISLVHLGYTVDIAVSGVEALDKYRSKNGAYDLIILDMLMPNLSGSEVFFRLRELNPDVRVLIISGYSSEAAVQRILASGGKGFIQKPFTIERLSREVRSSLDC